MPVPAPVFEEVRCRGAFACEYCRVREDEAGGLLTVDHHRPSAHGGSDDLENLVYACFRCNTYKADS
jgi:5-methylcytosine-specific restriction endonuclease McrA